MKILILSQSFIRYKGDNTSAYLFSLFKELQTIRVNVSVLSPHEENLPICEKIDGIDIYRFRYAPPKLERLAYRGNMHELVMESFFNKIILVGYIFFFFIKAMNVAEKEKVDIIHAHWWIPSGLIALLVSKFLDKPYIVTSHGTDVYILMKFKFLNSLARIVFRNATAITVVSSKIKSILTRELDINANKINVFPMPYDFSLFYPISEDGSKVYPYNNYDMKKNGRIVLSIGRLIELKGYDYLIEASHILKEKGKKFKLTIIGEGPEEQSLKAKTHSLSLNEEIEFLGFKPKADLNYFYNLCDVFVLPSITDSDGRQEGLGLVLLEAMSCKKPVIGTNSGGIPDIIKDGETGLLVPEKDSEALADAIERLLKDEELATHLAVNGYKYVVENFSPSKIAAKMLKVYSEVIKKKT